jgi:hypothetical protein
MTPSIAQTIYPEVSGRLTGNEIERMWKEAERN